MPDQPLVMISHPMLGGLRSPLEAAGYAVTARDSLTPAEAARVRAIVHAGEIVLEPDFLAALPALELIACVSVGYDGVDTAWCAGRGIKVSHADGLNADDVADLGMGLLLAAWRNVVAGDQAVRAGLWRDTPSVGPRPGLKGRKLGVMGLGHIGLAVARRAEAFGMVVSWWGPNPKPDAPWPRAESLLDLARDSDILMVACRADASNRKAVSAEVIEAVGPRGLIVNVARGSIIDEEALIAALKDGRLGRAALDVFAPEPTTAERWADVPRTVLTPHIGGASIDSLPQMFGQALENLRRHFAGEPLLSPVALT